MLLKLASDIDKTLAEFLLLQEIRTEFHPYLSIHLDKHELKL